MASTCFWVRGSALGGLSLLMYVGVFVGMGGLIGGLTMFPTTFVGTICTFVAVPAMLVGIWMILTKVKETKGTDLDAIA